MTPQPTTVNIFPLKKSKLYIKLSSITNTTYSVQEYFQE